MAQTTAFVFIPIVFFLIATSNVSAREFQSTKDIAARLEGGVEGGFMECWNALYELKSCTNEIVLFFLNGQTSLGPECCRAVHVITTNCWPAMLTSLGFTPEEGNVLQGYCDKPMSAGSGPAPAPLA